MSFKLSSVTIPTATEYSADEPFKNLENLAYVFLQIAALAAADDDFTITGNGELEKSIYSFSASVLAAAGMNQL
jgi:hypothetical protein